MKRREELLVIVCLMIAALGMGLVLGFARVPFGPSFLIAGCFVVGVIPPCLLLRAKRKATNRRNGPE